MRVKATTVRSRIQFVRERFGQEALEAVLAALGPQDRHYAESALPASWLPFDLVNRLDGEIVRQLGNDRVEFAREFGKFSAHENLKSVYRMFVEQAAGDPQSLMEGLASLHSNFYDWGSMKASRVGEGRCRVEVDYSGAASRRNCQTAIGFYAEALRLLGIAEPEVREVSCQAEGAALCAYELSWS